MKRLKNYVFPSALLVVLAIACEEFQTETFTMDQKDAQACEQLADSLGDSVSTVNLTKIDSAWTNSAVGNFVAAIIDTLEDRNIVLAANAGRYTLFTPANVDTNYLSLQTTGGTVIVYVADWVDIDIVKSDGNIRRPSGSSVSLETAYECSEIKVRFEISTEAGSNLFRVLKNDQTRLSSFDLTILKN